MRTETLGYFRGQCGEKQSTADEAHRKPPAAKQLLTTTTAAVAVAVATNYRRRPSVRPKNTMTERPTNRLNSRPTYRPTDRTNECTSKSGRVKQFLYQQRHFAY
ncbi:unnamed protein product [Soboliphyme baturini]|uniref:Uncharacterized protein n=1 Tax=Soboliphyme baturini TaxID=241478 RepID=A0A183J6F5_9BILA|nr:unnamed protein product [Soboliphyme baturini]